MIEIDTGFKSEFNPETASNNDAATNPNIKVIEVAPKTDNKVVEYPNQQIDLTKEANEHSVAT